MTSTLKRTLLGISGLLLFACGTAQAQTTIRMEAEDMTLDTYNVEMLDFASNGALINLKGYGYVGSATAPFSGDDGSYDVTVVYHDENDGLAQLSVSIDGTEVDSWTLDQLIPGGNQAIEANRFSREIATGYAVNNGDEIRIYGLQGNWDHANVDYIEFVGAGSSGTGNPPIVLDFSGSLPLVLEEPGYYVLDRDWDLYADGVGPVLDVEGDDITIDLRGFEIEVTTEDWFRINGNRVTLKNGSLHSGGVAVYGTDARFTGLQIRIEDDETAISFKGERGRVDNSVINCVEWCIPISVRASHITIQSNRITVDGGTAILTPYTPVGIQEEVSFVLILDNVIDCGSDECITLRGNNNVIARNTETGLIERVFVDLQGNDNQILDNTVLHAGDSTTFATIDGTRNLIRGNILRSPDDPGDKARIGISFLQDGNFYGDNLMWAITPFSLNGTVQTDLGGNEGL